MCPFSPSFQWSGLCKWLRFTIWNWWGSHHLHRIGNVVAFRPKEPAGYLGLSLCMSSSHWLWLPYMTDVLQYRLRYSWSSGLRRYVHCQKHKITLHTYSWLLLHIYPKEYLHAWFRIRQKRERNIPSEPMPMKVQVLRTVESDNAVSVIKPCDTNKSLPLTPRSYDPAGHVWWKAKYLGKRIYNKDHIPNVCE